MIDAIENSAFAIWVRESPSLFAYTAILSLHAMGLAIIVGINTIVALRLLGYVPRAELAALMNGAAAFVYPSLYEGSGCSASCRRSP